MNTFRYFPTTTQPSTTQLEGIAQDNLSSHFKSNRNKLQAELNTVRRSARNDLIAIILTGAGLIYGISGNTYYHKTLAVASAIGLTCKAVKYGQHTTQIAYTLDELDQNLATEAIVSHMASLLQSPPAETSKTTQETNEDSMPEIIN